MNTRLGFFASLRYRQDHRPNAQVTGPVFRVASVFVVLLLATTGTVRAELPTAAALAESIGTEQIVFAERPYGPDGHYYANFGSYCENPQEKAYPIGGRLCVLNLRTGEKTILLDDPQGGVRDPQVDFDGRKILFAYRRGGEEHYHLYEISTDGTGLRQLTDGPCDDIEPAYLPDGRIVFCSSRCNRWVMCWSVPVAILYVCDADGQNVRMLSSNAVTENTPAVLPDGRILYTRWEYVSRSQLCYHHLWTILPDGTGQMTFYGNMHPIGKPYALSAQEGTRVQYNNVPGAVAMLDAKPIPGTDRVIASFSPGHGRREHAGFLTIIDPRRGPDDPASAVQIHPDGNWRDPYPLTDNLFLAARERDLFLINGQGETQLLYRLDDFSPGMILHEPSPIRPRPRPPVPKGTTDAAAVTGRLILTDVYRGRNMAGVARGRIKKLLVLEQLPGPFHNSPGFDGISLWGAFTIQRILGTVPVEADGSAYFEAPAMRSLLFVALDENDLAVKRMQSFVTIQPGEVTGCVGCHEPRTQTPSNPGHATLDALRRPASPIQPIADVPQIVDFARHIQPIFDQHCAECHGPSEPKGGIILSTGQTYPSHGLGRVAQSYIALVNRLDEVVDGRNAHGNRPPYGFGSGSSKLMTRIDGSHYDVKVSPREAKLVRLWLDSGAVANGTYAIMHGGTPEKPSPLYIRQMQIYGLLPEDFDPDRDGLDVYALDEAYWQTFWLENQRAETATMENSSVDQAAAPVPQN